MRRRANMAADLIHHDAQCLPGRWRAGAEVHLSNMIRPTAMETVQEAGLNLCHDREHILEVEVGLEAGVQVLVGIEAERLVDPLVPKEPP